ncbi:MAG: NAD(P)-dependent alcohol dehydrogenase [Acidobacteriota bacterium]
MQAVRFARFGGPEVLEVVEVPRPSPRRGEALVRVRAAALNPKDTFVRKGRFRWLSGRPPLATGFDFAGDVAALGPSTEGCGLELEQPVYGMLDGFRGGACAEYVVAPAATLAPMPSRLAYDEAAAVPLVTSTALQALRDRGGWQPGQKVCINGASGGVGSMAVQLARLQGLSVTAISSAARREFLTELGAERVVDYARVDITASDERFDLFFDVFGNRPFAAVKPILTERGVWISTVLRFHVVRSLAATVFGRGKRARLIVVRPSGQDLRQIGQWIDAGKLRPIVSQRFDLSEIAAAHAELESKHTCGKLVLRI